MKQPDMNKLSNLFGTSADIARIAGASTSAVSRWGRYKIAPAYQKKLLAAAGERKLKKTEVAKALGMEPCPACGAYHLNGKTVR
jgi:hypothetical protein